MEMLVVVSTITAVVMTLVVLIAVFQPLGPNGQSRWDRFKTMGSVLLGIYVATGLLYYIHFRPDAAIPPEQVAVQAQKEQQEQLQSTARHLELRDEGAALSISDDVGETRIYYLLNSLMTYTGYSAQRISDLTEKTRGVIENHYGKSIKNRDLLEAAYKELPNSSTKPSLESFYLALANQFGSAAQ